MFDNHRCATSQGSARTESRILCCADFRRELRGTGETLKSDMTSAARH